MLSSLRTIVQEVNSARSLPEVLSIIVKEVRSAMSAGVCSVYLFDPSDNRYVLMATEGLRKESIGKVRLLMRQGLVGLVAAKQEPLNLEDADQHPNFSYFEETGEAPFHSFLGVPIPATRVKPRLLSKSAMRCAPILPTTSLGTPFNIRLAPKFSSTVIMAPPAVA